jgi:hypothetical protein
MYHLLILNVIREEIFSIYKGVKILGKHPCGYRGGDPMVVGFITTYAISAYHQ